MNIREHPLAWRWIDPKHVEFPSNVLAQITPLDPAAAAAVHDRWLPRFDRFGEIIPDQFSLVETCLTEGSWSGNVCGRDTSLIEQVTVWLRQREPDLELGITVCWSRDCAIRTTWGIFTQRWDDFCYAASDDAFVVADDPRWFLAFHHEDWFSFGHLPPAS